jgi:hypothetical protein
MSKINLDKFLFRGFHPNIFIGMASDRYAGWTGRGPRTMGGFNSRQRRI